MSTPTKRLLIAARALIATPDGWTKGEFARDETGLCCGSRSAAAVCFCTMGAVKAATLRERFDDTVEDRAVDVLRDRVLRDFSFGGIANFNDHPKTTHADVLALFDKAIEVAP